MGEPAVRALLLDIGGVMLSKGWGRDSRALAANRFGYDQAEMEDRHDLSFVAYEEGRLTLDEYLDQVVFHRERDFRREDYKAFMMAQSQPYPDMLELFRTLKERTGLKMVAVSNEGRELMVHRERAFDLGGFLDFFVVSCFVHRRKPDPAIYGMALDQSLLTPDEVVYVDDNPLLAEVAQALGIRSIHHQERGQTQAALAAFGVSAG